MPLTGPLKGLSSEVCFQAMSEFVMFVPPSCTKGARFGLRTMKNALSLVLGFAILAFTTSLNALEVDHESVSGNGQARA